ncbi:type I polyketide synthase [Paenibacillaceae sp. P-4]|uniref:type I polyketide synthase n=1 Tax=Paenibacillaceae bacterium P-4 TaxID=3160969 RepID=UPI0032E846E4
MIDIDAYKKQILQMVRNQELTAEAGLKLYKILQADEFLTQSRISDEGIAVIGISGRFPEADNVHEYWTNLASGRDSVKEITRWDVNGFYDADRKSKDKSYCKDGGFMSNIDKFDPLFFNISPRQAELMDPRQRLFLQEAWKVLEDAGYSNRDVAGKKIGVYVGCEGDTDYFASCETGSEIGSELFLGNSNSILASRISYFLDLKGPSITLDTACSSSLVAIHLASESIRSGECEMAICGGIALYTTSQGYVLASRMGMLSPDGRCKAFDDRANGFVPGEAVGAVLLKSAAKAIRDRDHIYGIIRASGINQDGKTNGITAPSSMSQTALETEIYRRFGIDPATITYVEAHGTGTKLGDPIEFHALQESFKLFTSDKQFCGLGSVKTNIGHTGAASGLAGFIKILLAMKHRQLPPTLHFEKENSQICLRESPFYMVTELTSWSADPGNPRRAAISSFGHSGTNCHMVLEEYDIQVEEPDEYPASMQLFPISAKSKDSLRQKISDLLAWCQENGRSTSVKEIAYSLQTGRSHFDYRIALLANSMEDFVERLNDAAAGNSHQHIFCGMDKSARNKEDIPSDEKKESMRLVQALRQSDPVGSERENLLQRLGQLYCDRVYIDWNGAYGDAEVRKVPLPSYPFAMKKYWLSETAAVKSEAVNLGHLHPLLDSNESVFGLQRYKKTFHLSESIIKDHVIGGNVVVPGAVYLEMARAAGQLSYPEKKVTAISNIFWLKPLQVSTPTEAWLRLEPTGEQTAEFQIAAGADDREHIHARGKVRYASKGENEPDLGELPVDAIRARSAERLSGLDCYGIFRSMGFHYGVSFQTIESVSASEHEVLSRYCLPDHLKNSSKSYLLHPVLLDGAFQSLIGFGGAEEDGEEMFLPFSIGEVKWSGSVCDVGYVYVQYRDVQLPGGEQAKRYRLCITDIEGKVRVLVTDYLVRKVPVSKKSAAMSDAELLEMLNSVKKGTASSLEIVQLLGGNRI